MSKAIVTGACGFIGTCLCERLFKEGWQVIGIDNLFRPGSEHNAAAFKKRGGELYRIDLSSTEKTNYVFSQIGSVDAVFHLAAQVAVTTSYLHPTNDFLDNAVASFNVIEAIRRYTPEAYCLYASTNKVYGHITESTPVGSRHPLAPYTPYGVSKAVGEIYFTEYGRPEMGLTTCCLRQSCIYGHHQYGLEDQGWLAWFAIANLLEKQVTIYGDGHQVRDLLFVDDLVELYLECFQRRHTGVHPVGGGPENQINLLDGLEKIQQETGKDFLPMHYAETRPGDQPYFVADLSWLEQTDLTWRPSVGIAEGLKSMILWIKENLHNINEFRFK